MFYIYSISINIKQDINDSVPFWDCWYRVRMYDSFGSRGMVFRFCLFQIHKACEKQTDCGFAEEVNAFPRIHDGHSDAKQSKVL